MYQWFGVHAHSGNYDAVVKLELMFSDRYTEDLGIDMIGMVYISILCYLLQPSSDVICQWMLDCYIRKILCGGYRRIPYSSMYGSELFIC